MHVLIGSNGTNFCYMQVLKLMVPKQDRVYSHGRSKSTPSARLVIGSNDERDPEYVPPGTVTPTWVARTTIDTPIKVALGVVTASQSEEEHIMTSTPSGSATHSNDASGSDEVSGS